MTSNVNSEPEGLPACILRAAINGKGIEWFTISASLPHYLALAETIEAESRAAASTRLPGLGVPIPTEVEPGFARLWATWRKTRDGGAVLDGIEIRLGKDRSGKRVIKLLRRDDGTFGALWGLRTQHPRYRESRAQLLAVGRALDAFAALAGEQDPLAAAAHLGARGGFCMCCG
jgi:hypothetical protein